MPSTIKLGRTRQRGRATGFALAAVLVGVPAIAEDKLRIELEIRNTSAPTDDYLTWAPTAARIRLAVPGQEQTVVLTNDPPSPVPAGRQTALDGDVVFAESVKTGETATQESLRLTLPGDGSWRTFVVAGKFGRPSTRDKDAGIEVHLGTPDGPVVHSHEAMVRIRKNVNALTAHERDRFLQAVSDLHFRRNHYLYFVEMHDLAANGKMTLKWPDQSHRASSFLAWHRAFLLQFERELQERFPDVALPYWVMDKPSNLFTPDFMGQNEISDRAFVKVEFSPGHPLENWQMGGQNLTRFPHDRTSPQQLSDFRKEENLLRQTDYDQFRRLTEGNPHNNGHRWVGPWMQNCMVSPRDPVFWPFHSGFDRLWARWQSEYGRFGTTGSNPKDYSPTDAYEPNAPGCDDPNPNQCVPKGHHLRDTMWPWDGSFGDGVNAKANRPPKPFGGPFPPSTIPGLWPEQPAAPVPADVIDFAGLAPERLDMGFAYDDVPYGVKPRGSVVLAAARASSPVQPSAKSLARRVASVTRSDSERIQSLRALDDEEVALEQALKILRDPRDGGAALDAEAVEVLWVQMMFTNPGLTRHHEIHHALSQVVNDARRPVRVAAIRKLAPLRDPAAVEALVRSLGTPEGAAFEPEEALWLLQSAGVGEHVAVVRPYLSHPDSGVRSAAVSALVKDPESHSRLLQILGDRSEVFEVRAAALSTVLAGVDGALAKAALLLGDPSTDSRLRIRAAAVLDLRLNSPEPRVLQQELTTVLEQLRRLELDSLDAASAPTFRALRAAEGLLSQSKRK